VLGRCTWAAQVAGGRSAKARAVASGSGRDGRGQVARSVRGGAVRTVGWASDQFSLSGCTVAVGRSGFLFK
jgi:hypothetical protein